MTSMTTMPYREWTVGDLANLPDDGRRYELVDGVLLVSSAPSDLHQVASRNLFRLLDAHAPEPMEVLFAPVNVIFTSTRLLQPDLMVFPELRDLLGKPAERALPLLAIEVLSPSTRAVDTTLKRHVCEQGGIPSYWLVDPIEPSVTILELTDGMYVERGTWGGDEAVEVTAPFALSFRPSRLVR